MTSAAKLLADLRRRGALLTVRPPDRIHISAPQGAITAEQRRAIADRKTELITLLRAEPEAPTIDLAKLDRERYEADKKIFRGYDVEATIPLDNIPSKLHTWPLERLTDVARLLAQGCEIVMFDEKDNQFVVITGAPSGVLWKLWREE